MNWQRLLVIFVVINLSCTEKAQEKLSSKDFINKANKELKQESHFASLASWVQANFITPDTTKISADYSARYSKLATDLAMTSKDYRGKTDDEKRMLELMLKVLTVPAPRNEALNKELSNLKSELESMYGSGKYCPTPDKCQSLEDLEKVIAKSRDPEELLKAWDGWRTTAVAMKPKFQRTVEIGNLGAQELGYANMADLWRSNYDMEPQAFEKELDRLWNEIKPFYEQLHCYVRSQLNKKYGNEVVALDQPIPAHLLGNMWAQSWDNIQDIVGIKEGPGAVDITSLLEKEKFTPKKMVKTAENFFVSLGMPELPKTFYQYSLFEKPKDREVVCHASAWHIDLEDDVRIKMCIEINEDSFRTIHHELGHIYYYLAYKDLPTLYQTSANDGFHEALGDTIELSITGKYLKDIQLLDSQSSTQNANSTLLRMALGKMAFLPFGLMIDKWRWQVFDGRTKAESYNKDWWTLREKYQGVKAPNQRPSDAFDPGAKYHIPAYTPYSRYFLAHILQFQFHRALCQTAGHKGPLHECSIFNSKEAGQKLWEMMKLGISKPWPQALKKVTGSSQMDATAIRDYFAPLEGWLKEQNKNLKCGW